jgi:hypothetical protein
MNNVSFHFTPAVILAAVGAAITLAVTFGLDISQAQQDAILKFAGILLGAVVVGGGLKSAGMFVAGVHPTQTRKGTTYAGR